MHCLHDLHCKIFLGDRSLPAWQNHFTFSISTQSAMCVSFPCCTKRFFREMFLYFASKSWNSSYRVCSCRIIRKPVLSQEPVSSKRYKFACAPIKDSDQSAHPRSLIRVFDGRSKGSQGSNDSSSEKNRTLVRICGCVD